MWRRTRDDALADDLTALTFERCWDALPGFRLRGDSARPWLMRIAANAIASHFRSEGRRRRREDTSAAGDARLRVATEPERAVLAEDTELLGALAALGERYQQVLSLRFLAGLTTEEAADAMRVNRKHFAALQYRALAALRRELSRRGMEVADG